MNYLIKIYLDLICKNISFIYTEKNIMVVANDNKMMEMPEGDLLDENI